MSTESKLTLPDKFRKESLTLEEARELRDELNRWLGSELVIHMQQWPCPYPQPIYCQATDQFKTGDPREAWMTIG